MLDSSHWSEIAKHNINNVLLIKNKAVFYLLANHTFEALLPESREVKYFSQLLAKTLMKLKNVLL